MSPTLRASPWGEVPSLSRRRGVSLTFRYSHFYRLHTSLYLNTSSIRLNSYAYKLQSPLSRPGGRQLSQRRASSFFIKVLSACGPLPPHYVRHLPQGAGKTNSVGFCTKSYYWSFMFSLRYIIACISTQN